MDNPAVWFLAAFILWLGVDGYLLYCKRQRMVRKYNAQLRRLAEMLNQADRERREGGRK